MQKWLTTLTGIISIHAPSRERPFDGSANLNLCLISIHAPSRERHQKNVLDHHSNHFNPRSLAGATAAVHYCLDMIIFQSTLPRGSDICIESCFDFNQNFNPRSLAGATLTLNKFMKKSSYFNPRSLAGATVGVIVFFYHVQISIHAPSRERRTR